MGEKDKACKIIAEKESTWLGNVTQSLNPLGTLIKICGSWFVSLGNGEESRRMKGGGVLFFPFL